VIGCADAVAVRVFVSTLPSPERTVKMNKHYHYVITVALPLRDVQMADSILAVFNVASRHRKFRRQFFC
jgi:hypothetical protein